MGETYVYLLGLYLGDGCISRAPKNVWRLRIFQDQRYTNLIAACTSAMAEVGGVRVGHVQRVGCIEIGSYSKHWTCFFPQHGVGMKHERAIQLRAWQRHLVWVHPQALLRGLIHSDGCRVINRVKRPLKGGVKEYDYVRYFFTNMSPDIRQLFTEACALIGVDCRPDGEKNISVARRHSVRLLEEFIGPKS